MRLKLIFLGLYIIFLNISSNQNALRYANTNEMIQETAPITADRDFISGNGWNSMDDNSCLYLEDDGTFVWYQDKTDEADNYYAGTFTILWEDEMNQFFKDNGISEDDVKGLQDIFVQDNACCLVTLLNKELVIDGMNLLRAPAESYYFGIYKESDANQIQLLNLSSGAMHSFRK